MDESGQSTQLITETRQRAEIITPIPKPKARKKAAAQTEIVLDEGKGLLGYREHVTVGRSLSRVVRSHSIRRRATGHARLCSWITLP